MQNDVAVFHKIVVFGMNLLENFLKEKVADYQKIVDDPMDVFSETHKENLALLNRELLHISHTADFLKIEQPQGFKTALEYKNYLIESITKNFHDKGVPHACTCIIVDKINDCFSFFEGFKQE